MTLHMVSRESRPYYLRHLKPITDEMTEIGPDVALCPSYHDVTRAVRQGFEHIVLAQHGAGQSYGGDPIMARNSGYPGGKDNGCVSLFLCPNEHSASRWRQAYPTTPVAVVGSPRLDTLPRRQLSPFEPEAVVAVSFHWDGHGIPELRNGSKHFREAVKELAVRYKVIGHGHPLWRDRQNYWRHLGVEFVPDFDDVCRRADLYVCDNSSTLYEFAATGRPVVVLNHPGYRKDVEHGLRFWEASRVGLNVDDPADLAEVVKAALEDRQWDQWNRWSALDIVFGPYRTGAGVRAASALVQWAETLEHVAA